MPSCPHALICLDFHFIFAKADHVGSWGLLGEFCPHECRNAVVKLRILIPNMSGNPFFRVLLRLASLLHTVPYSAGLFSLAYCIAFVPQFPAELVWPC